jgi:hypothetical protein
MATTVERIIQLGRDNKWADLRELLANQVNCWQYCESGAGLIGTFFALSESGNFKRILIVPATDA